MSYCFIASDFIFMTEAIAVVVFDASHSPVVKDLLTHLGVPPVQVQPAYVMHTDRGESELTHEWSGIDTSRDCV